MYTLLKFTKLISTTTEIDLLLQINVQLTYFIMPIYYMSHKNHHDAKWRRFKTRSFSNFFEFSRFVRHAVISSDITNGARAPPVFTPSLRREILILDTRTCLCSRRECTLRIRPTNWQRTLEVFHGQSDTTFDRFIPEGTYITYIYEAPEMTLTHHRKLEVSRRPTFIESSVYMQRSQRSS